MEEWIRQKAEQEKEKKVLRVKKQFSDLKRLEIRAPKESSLKHFSINRTPSSKTEIAENSSQIIFCTETLYSPALTIMKESSSRIQVKIKSDDPPYKRKFKTHKKDEIKRKKDKFLFDVYFPQRKKKVLDSSISIT